MYTIDSGEHYFFATHYLRSTRPDTFMVMTGLGSMGSSLGAAIGAQLARPKRSVAVICGDGGFAMTCGEVATAAAEKLPIVFVVFNDQRLGMVELGHLALFGRTPSFAMGRSTSPASDAHWRRRVGDRSARCAARIRPAPTTARSPAGHRSSNRPAVKMPKTEDSKHSVRRGSHEQLEQERRHLRNRHYLPEIVRTNDWCRRRPLPVEGEGTAKLDRAADNAEELRRRRHESCSVHGRGPRRSLQGAKERRIMPETC